MIAFVWKLSLLSLSVVSLLWLFSFTSPAAAASLAKLAKFGSGFLTMALSTDKRFKAPKEDPDLIKGAADAVTKRVIFIRHGESDWNEVFNRGFGPSFPMRLLMAILRELRLAETPDSVFIDSGLSPLGMQQARELMTFLEGSADPTDNAGMHALLRGDGRAQEDSVVMSSNLRRALATAAIGLQRRLHLTGERVLIVSDLQEITFNLDGNALAGSQEVPDLHAIKGEMWAGCEPAALFDPALNTGDKPINGTGLQRMQRFAELVFKRKESTIIAVGHSLYFRSFFRTFLPYSVDHNAKKLKMVNAGTVAFNLSTATRNGKPLYRIEPSSISTIYGGFAK